jgi:hypothetical protein
MVQFIGFIIALTLLAFWLWMYLDMAKNESLPPCFISISNGLNAKSDWAAAFLILNVFSAGYYYFTEYAKDSLDAHQ